MTRQVLAIGLLILAGLTPAYSTDPSTRPPEEESGVTLKEAITKGKPILSFRYRYENVTDDAVGEKHARASTLRTTFGYRSLPRKGLSFLIEGENVANIGNDLYNNNGLGDDHNGVTDRPVVADVANTGINQAYGQYVIGESQFRLGRTEILVGDQRYVGNVAWRQNHQSFDAFTVRSNSLDWLSLFYSYIDNASRANWGNAPMKTNLVNAGFKLGKVGTLTTYAYFLDYEQGNFFFQSTKTFGGEFMGSWRLNNKTTLLYELEYADQADYGDNPADVSTDYIYLLGGIAFKPVQVSLAHEVLGGSLENGRFSTPLGTLHKWNGWADKFLTTPDQGLTDFYIQVDGQVFLESSRKFMSWSVRYHDFESDEDSIPYGTELDFELFFFTHWGQGFGLNGAFYKADQFAADTTKIWIYTTYKI